MKQGSKTWVKGGPSPNPNGRPKGSKNKMNREIRDIIRKAIHKNIKSLEADMESLSAMEKVKLYSVLMKFVVPTEEREIKKKVTNEIKVSLSYKKPNELPDQSNKTIDIEDFKVIDPIELPKKG